MQGAFAIVKPGEMMTMHVGDDCMMNIHGNQGSIDVTFVGEGRPMFNIFVRETEDGNSALFNVPVGSLGVWEERRHELHG